MKSFRLIAVAVTSVLVGCSSSPTTPPIMSESLITTITDQGLKQFTYQIVMNMNAQRRGGGAGMGGLGRMGMGGRGGAGMGGGGGMGGAMKNKEEMRRKMESRVEQAVLGRLETKLTETGYCQHGWFVIRQDIRPGYGEVEGECKAKEATPL